jgi:DNA-directed RNA polymerase sigma subunit (sigma70/sigma32)
MNKTHTYFKAFIEHSKKLSEKEKKILIARFENKTLQQIAELYGLKKGEFIRHTELKALTKLFGFLVKEKNKKYILLRV